MKIKLSGLTCAACAKLAAKRIGKIPGVSAVHVDESNGRANIMTEKVIPLDAINASLRDTAYRAELD